MPSSVIAAMHYNADTLRLKIVFVSGLVYEYLDVPKEVYKAMKASGSKGIYLNKYIKGHYQFEKVE